MCGLYPSHRFLSNVLHIKDENTEVRCDWFIQKKINLFCAANYKPVFEIEFRVKLSLFFSAFTYFNGYVVSNLLNVINWVEKKLRQRIN